MTLKVISTSSWQHMKNSAFETELVLNKHFSNAGKLLKFCEIQHLRDVAFVAVNLLNGQNPFKEEENNVN